MKPCRIHGGQRQQGEHCGHNQPAHDGNCHRAPENRARQWNHGQHSGHCGQHDRPQSPHSALHNYPRRARRRHGPARSGPSWAIRKMVAPGATTCPRLASTATTTPDTPDTSCHKSGVLCLVALCSYFTFRCGQSLAAPVIIRVKSPERPRLPVRPARGAAVHRAAALAEFFWAYSYPDAPRFPSRRPAL